MLYTLIKFSQAKDIFVCDFMDVVKICQAQLHVSYVVSNLKIVARYIPWVSFIVGSW
jgi:hypothetical protein